MIEFGNNRLDFGVVLKLKAELPFWSRQRSQNDLRYFDEIDIIIGLVRLFTCSSEYLDAPCQWFIGY